MKKKLMLLALGCLALCLALTQPALAEANSESTDLADFLADWRLKVGDAVYAMDTVNDNTVIEYQPGVKYALELTFAENSTLRFATAAENPPEMLYQLPDGFIVSPDYVARVNVPLGQKGVLPDNVVSVVEGSASGANADGKLHTFLKLRWNWEDSHWSFFRAASNVNLKIVVDGVFEDRNPLVMSINGRDIKVQKADPHNAVVNLSGQLDKATGVIEYTVIVASQGTTRDISLTAAPGSALTYLTDSAHNGGVVYVDDESVNSANTVPQITQKTGNTFKVVIPAMSDGDRLVFRYFATADVGAIAVSGNPTFAETGSTASIAGDTDALDNAATYHETDIEFSDLELNCINTELRVEDGARRYVLTYQTVVDMPAEGSVTAVNTAAGRGGIDSDIAFLPSADNDLDVQMSATNVGTMHVTWEIRMTLSGDSFDFERLLLVGHSGNNSNNPNGWSDDRLPYRNITIPHQEKRFFRETLQKVDVLGLEGEETFSIAYNDRVYDPADGSSVREGPFSEKGNDSARFSMEFFKDAARQNGSLNKPDGDTEEIKYKRTIIVRLTTEFSADWAIWARDYQLATESTEVWLYDHINWISVETPDENQILKVRAKAIDKLRVIPPHVYLSIPKNHDATLDSANGHMFLVDYPNYAVTLQPDPDGPVYPAFRCRALANNAVAGEPLVIEGTFDTTLFDLILADNLQGGKYIMTKGSRQLTQDYFPRVYGQTLYFDAPETVYCFGYKSANEYQKAEDHGCSIEYNATGFRAVIGAPFRQEDGSLYPFYGL